MFKCRPICRTVADAVRVLDAIVGYDEFDEVATRAASKYIPEGGYTQFLKIDGLKGKRIGVPNGFFDFEHETVRQMEYQQHLNTLRWFSEPSSLVFNSLQQIIIQCYVLFISVIMFIRGD
jgi:Asp-tRNA(Asn)/Glu-tRNA(Gln) amidotransferase A subunit family amidase